jgi:mono/diheme cytochrome c family protein
MKRAPLGLLAALALLGAGCGALPRSRAAGGVATLAVKAVPWNAAGAPIGAVRAVADTGDVVCVFAEDGASVFSAGAVVARDAHVKGWISGDSIYSTDGAARWIVGVDGAGRLYRLRALSAFEDVSARYQLAGRRVRSAAVIGPGRVGFLLDNEIALSDASRLAVVPSAPFTMFAGGGGFFAGVTRQGIDVVNATNGLVTRFALPGAAWAALDDRGRLYAATRRAVYAADGGGALALVYDAGRDGIHGLVASGDRVWFADQGELGVILGDRVAATTGAHLDADAKLQRSPSGDVWVLGAGKLERFAAEGGASTASVGGGAASPTTTASTWRSTIAPIFARSCASCHQPNGSSGTDLSNEAAWSHLRALIRERVLVTRTMPPQDHPISDADRAVIHGWIEGAR